MRRLRRGLGSLLLLTIFEAWAALGGLEQDVAHEGQSVPPHSTLGHALLASPLGIHQQTIMDARNITITEFSVNSVVFALRWTGPTLPDYAVFLANYFPAYQQAQPLAQGHYRQPIAIRLNHLVVHANGHMGAYQGSAYDPTLVPSGLSLSVLGIAP